MNEDSFSIKLIREFFLDCFLLSLEAGVVMKEKRTLTPLPSLRRIPAYLRLLKDLRNSKLDTVSCTVIAKKLKREPTQIRKDLAFAGAIGKPKVGYQVENLINCLERFLGWDHLTQAVLVGTGKLGTSLLAYGGFLNHGIDIVATFDEDPVLIGQTCHGRKIFAIEELVEILRLQQIPIGIITVPSYFAQGIAEQMIDGGIKAIWNFTSARLDIPDGIIVENEDLFASLAVLCGRLNQH